MALAARATNDAGSSAWDVKTGAPSWPQGRENLLGYTLAHRENRIRFWEEKIHPEDRARTAAGIAEALRAPTEHWSGEYRFRRADGSYIRLLERALIIRDSGGTAQQFVGSLMDITARKQLQDQLVRSQKNGGLRSARRRCSARLHNFLTTILGYSDLALDSLGAKSKPARHIAEIREAAERASTLTSQLLAFSRKHPLEPRVVEVNSVISNMERLFASAATGENISVRCRLHNDKAGAHIRVDPGQLTQVLLNLAVNARDAMHGDGQLILETSSVTIEPSAEKTKSTSRNSHRAITSLGCNDNGAGMDEETKAHLFEPFFSTKDHGSGLGLATSYGIIKQSGGSILIESESHKGTRGKNLPPESRCARRQLSETERKNADRHRNHHRARRRHQRPAHVCASVLRNLGA